MDCSPIRYKILAHRHQVGKRLKLIDFPELNIIYESFENNLCLSHYTDMATYWSGHLRILFNVNNQHVLLSDTDSKHGKINVLDFNGYSYIFQGLSTYILSKSRDRTYLIFRIIKVPSKWR